MWNVEALKRSHDHFLGRQEVAIGEALATAGHHAEEHVKRYAPFRRRTGRLQDNTKSVVLRTAGGRLVRIYNRMPYAAAIDTGAKPHTIVPRRSRFLRFRVGGAWVFAKKVRHPGNKPYKFLYRAADSASRVLGQELARRLGAIARRF